MDTPQRPSQCKTPLSQHSTLSMLSPQSCKTAVTSANVEIPCLELPRYRVVYPHTCRRSDIRMKEYPHDNPPYLCTSKHTA